ncbi:MAG: adenosine deaminase [Saprospiraceae bacterium]|nr:adenosine deaminase [Saprospiraceae bacterium]
MQLKGSFIQSLPKIELHVHLDCSLSYDVVKKMDPQVTESYYQQHFIGPVRCNDLSDYLQRADHALKLMQTSEHMVMAVEDLYDQFMRDHIIYGEIRFAPLLHTKGELTPKQVVRIVTQTALRCQEERNIKGGIILCTLRHFNQEESMKTAALACQFYNKGVIGFDIASDELGHPLNNHLEAFKKVQEQGIPCTAHAGEARGAESVWETLEKLHPQRIGHGVRSTEDDHLLRHLKNKNIHLEICPTSNIQTRACKDLHSHPIDKMYHLGLSLSVNTDARTISNTTSTREYLLLQEVFKWTIEHFYSCNKEAIKHAFTSGTIKKVIDDQLDKAYLKYL